MFFFLFFKLLLSPSFVLVLFGVMFLQTSIFFSFFFPFSFMMVKFASWDFVFNDQGPFVGLKI